MLVVYRWCCRRCRILDTHNCWPGEPLPAAAPVCSCGFYLQLVSGRLVGGSVTTESEQALVDGHSGKLIGINAGPHDFDFDLKPIPWSTEKSNVGGSTT